MSDFTAMNSLAEKYGDKITILGFPCNQFGHQTNENEEEFLNTLKYVRPGGGFEPKGIITSKVNVNGADAHPLWKFMKAAKPLPMDTGAGDTKGNGCDDWDALVLPRGAFGGTTISLWTPICRSDVAWNFEKFLVGADGQVVERYSRYYPTADIAADIDKLV